MSGGSWDYLYSKVDDAAAQLTYSENPLRRALGRHLVLVAKALHDIEWTDSGDNAKDSENTAIEQVLGANVRTLVLTEVIEEAKQVNEKLAKLISSV
jgi:hypothetical protein